MWPFNNDDKLTEKIAAGDYPSRPNKYWVVKDKKSGRTAILFEKKLKWVSFDPHQVEQLCEWLKLSR